MHFNHASVPDAFNQLFFVVLFDNVVKPDIFNDDIHVILRAPWVNKAPLNTAGNLTVLSVDEYYVHHG